jgi:hypothetical protein
MGSLAVVGVEVGVRPCQRSAGSLEADLDAGARRDRSPAVSSVVIQGCRERGQPARGAR